MRGRLPSSPGQARGEGRRSPGDGAGGGGMTEMMGADLDPAPLSVGERVKMSPEGMREELKRVAAYSSGPERERAEREYRKALALRGTVLSVDRKGVGWAWTVRVRIDTYDGGRILSTWATCVERA